MTVDKASTTPLSDPKPVHAPKPANEPPGAGTLHLRTPTRARFVTQRASYPLKFLAPVPLPGQPPNVGVAYLIAYGGGLVAGDHVRIDTTVDAGCTLVLLTQGSTKVYKHRVGIRPHAHRLRHEAADLFGEGHEAPLTRQRMKVGVGAGGILLLLPDSVSPFRDSRYAQAQRVELAPGASALVLDWVNSGRGERPPLPVRVTARGRWKKWGDAKDGEDASADTEVWAMGYYASTNEIVIGSQVVARERMVLDNTAHDTRTQSAALSPVARRLAPYHVYATALIYGPKLATLRNVLEQLVDNSSQFQIPRPPGLLWSYSSLGDGGILRVAGTEVEDVRDWVREVFTLGGVRDIVGEGLWPRCI